MRRLLKTTGAIFLLLFLFTISSIGDINSTILNIDSRFLLKGMDNIDPRVVYKIDTIGSELYDKSGINLYLYAVDRYGVEQFSSMEQKISYIRDFEHNITRDLEAPFALLTLSIDDTHVNILNE